MTRTRLLAFLALFLGCTEASIDSSRSAPGKRYDVRCWLPTGNEAYASEGVEGGCDMNRCFWKEPDGGAVNVMYMPCIARLKGTE